MKIQRHSVFIFSLLSTAILFHLQLVSAAGDNSAAPPAAAPPAASANNIDYIRTSCQSTLYPVLCFNSLSRYADDIQQDPAMLARVAIGVSLSRANRMANYVSNLTREAEYGAEPRAISALHDCCSVFSDAVDQIRDSLKQMRGLGGSGESLRFEMSNVQTYMSAALTNEDTCTDGFQDVKDGPMKTDVCGRTVKVKQVTSNALALVNSYAAKVDFAT